MTHAPTLKTPPNRRCRGAVTTLVEMDAETLPAVGGTLALFAIIGVIFLIGKTDFGKAFDDPFYLGAANRVSVEGIVDA